MTAEYSAHPPGTASAAAASAPADPSVSTPSASTPAATPAKSKPKTSTATAPEANNNNKLPPCCQATAAAAAASCKKLSSSDPRIGPSPLRQLLPIALCILSFATVLSILIVYMDTTEIRHQQFRLNMTRDYVLYGVSQDNPTLIAYLRDFHMKKNPIHFLKNEPVEHLNFTERHEQTPEMAHLISDMVGCKPTGAFIQSMTGPTNNLMTAPWLAETLNWGGVIIEPEPRRYFSLKKHNLHRSKVQVVHACVSPNEHPKEITINRDDPEVRINSIPDEETYFVSHRVKCFPLYTLMLAVNRTNYDLLSLGVEGHELEILQTIPFNKVNIEVISIHLTDNQNNPKEYVQSITKFLMGKSFRLHKRIDLNYFYQKINTNRTRIRVVSTETP